MAEAITTARVVHEIPGITHFERRGPVPRPLTLEDRVALPVSIRGIIASDVPAFTAVMHEGLQRRTDLSDDQKAAEAKRRNSDYYADKLADPKQTLLAARDKKTGQIIGVLHGEESHEEVDKIDGQGIGYILQVAATAETGVRGIATSLYTVYEDQLRQQGNTVMAAAYDFENSASQRLHERAGMNNVYLRKTPQPKENPNPEKKSVLGELPGNAWFYKQIGSVDSDVTFPVTETDYLSSGLSMVASIASAAMLQEGLDSVEIEVIEGKSKGSEHLINVVSSTVRARRDFEVIMAEAAKLGSEANMLDIFNTTIKAAQERSVRRSIIKD